MGAVEDLSDVLLEFLQGHVLVHVALLKQRLGDAVVDRRPLRFSGFPGWPRRPWYDSVVENCVITDVFIPQQPGLFDNASGCKGVIKQ